MAPDGKTAQRSGTLSNGLLAAHIIMYCLSFLKDLSLLLLLLLSLGIAKALAMLKDLILD